MDKVIEVQQYAISKKDIIQSYIWTMARYDFSVHEKRIVYRIVELMQELLSGQKLNRDLRGSITKRLYDYTIKMPIAAFLVSEEDHNHFQAKKALRELSRKTVEYEDNNVWASIPIITFPKIWKNACEVEFVLHEDIYNAFMNFSKGYKKYEMITAMSFDSPNTMRFYEMFSKQRTPLTYTIKNLKLTFGVEKKYQRNTDFIKRVVEASKQELDEKSPYSFEYKPLKTGREFTSIKFFPTTTGNADEDYENRQLLKQIQPSTTITGLQMLDKLNQQYLTEHYKFSKPELQNNMALLQEAEKRMPDFLMFLSEVKAKANKAINPKGYLINAIKKRLNIKTEPKTAIKTAAQATVKNYKQKEKNKYGLTQERIKEYEAEHGSEAVRTLFEELEEGEKRHNAKTRTPQSIRELVKR